MLVGACRGNVGTPSASGTIGPSGSAGPEDTFVQVSLPPTPTPAPGLGRIVFAQFQGLADHNNVYSMNPDGSDLRLLLSGKHAIPRWSPDGTKVAVTTSSFHSTEFETIVNADGSGAHDLTRVDSSLALSCTAWSPGGDLLACEGWNPERAGREGIYTVNAADGSNLTRITTPSGGIHDVPGDFSPDGTQIVFVRATYTPVLLGQLWMANVDGTNARKITDTLTGYRVSWSPDGRWIAGSANGALLVFDLNDLTLEPRKIVIPKGSAFDPRWSRDGTKLVFSFVRNGVSASDIWSVNADGSHAIRLTTDPRTDQFADWGPAR
jgi:Tol biopolymer transport system component